MATTALRERWRRGGRSQDTILRAPTFLAADGELVYVLDRDPHAVTALRLADGSVAWRSDTMRHPARAWLRDIAALPTGGVAIVDDQRFLHRVSPAGEWRDPIALPGYWSPHTLCVPDDTSFVLYTLDREDPIVRVDTQGMVLARYPMPWPDLANATGVETQSRMATGPGGLCVVALGLGRGFATMHGATVVARQPYVEAVPLPKAVLSTVKVNGQEAVRAKLPRNRATATLAVAVRDSAILVLFGGTSPERFRVIDTYDLATGAYRESWRLPFPARAIAATADVVLAYGTSRGYPTLVALTPP